MIPGFDLIQFAQGSTPVIVLLIVAAIIFSESGLLIGFFLPGDSMLFTLGFLIQGISNFNLDLNINLAILVLFIAAVLGDNVGYAFGRKVGVKLFTKPNSILFRQENIQKAQDFYDTHGGKTIIIARFIPIVRTFAPIVAGVAKMRYRTFVIFNLIGGFIWTAGLIYIGFFLGKVLHNLGIEIDSIIIPVVLFLIILSISPALYHLLKDKQQRQAIWNATKLEWRKIIERKK